MSTVIGIVISLICFLILVGSHEFGHFAAGKILNMQINEFSIGMGPKLWSRKKGETEYALRAIPIGGFCAFEGEEEESDNPRAFVNQPWWAKIVVMLAGPFVNIVLAILIFTGVFCYLGYPSTTLASVPEGFPAAKAGIMAEDKILEVNGVPIKSFVDAQQSIAGAPSDKIDIKIQRGKDVLDFTCDTYINDYGNKSIGIVSKLAHPIKESFNDGVKETGIVFVAIADFIKGLFNGTSSASDVSGVVGIVSVMTESYQYGFVNVIYIFALITANLGYMNLLPFPALDGGRVLMTLLVKLSGDRIPRKAVLIINSIGMALLMILMVLLIFKDSIALLR